MEKQSNVKPKIEEIASEYLEEEKLNNILDFTSWLRANKMTPTFGSKSKIGISFTTRVCYIKLFQNSWYIWAAGKNGVYSDDFLECEKLEKIVVESLAKCTSCGHQCNSGLGYIKTVCGKEYKNICGCCSVRFCNPDVKTLDIIKKVIAKRNNSMKIK